MTEIEPMFDYLVVEKDEVKQETTGGIILTDTTKEKPSTGIVKKVGSGRYTENGTFVPNVSKVGDRVLFPWGLGQTIELDGKEVFLLRERDVIGFIR